MDMPLIQPVAILDEFWNLETCCTCFDQFKNTSGLGIVVKWSELQAFWNFGSRVLPVFKTNFRECACTFLYGMKSMKSRNKKHSNLTYQSCNSLRSPPHVSSPKVGESDAYQRGGFATSFGGGWGETESPSSVLLFFVCLSPVCPTQKNLMKDQ